MTQLPSNISASYRKQLFANINAHPIALNLCMLQEFGPAYLSWEPEACWDEVKLSFGVMLAEANRQKIQAVRSIYVADETLSSWEVFEAVAAGLVGVAPRVDTIQRPTPGRAHIALDIINYIRPNEVKDEVYRYCAAVLMDAGIIYGPGSLEPCNKYVPANETERSQVKNLVARGSLPASFSGSDLTYVQAMKSLAVKDFANSTAQQLAEQIRKLSE